jgi:hypothetical protein
MFAFIKTLLPEQFDLDLIIDSQASDYENRKALKYVQMPDNNVYWLDKNRIYYASVGNDGKFDPSEGKVTDMKNLPAKEVAKVLFIYNTLRNG